MPPLGEIQDSDKLMFLLKSKASLLEALNVGTARICYW